MLRICKPVRADWYVTTTFVQSRLKLKPYFSQSFPLHSHLSLPEAHLMEFDHSVFDSHWQW